MSILAALAAQQSGSFADPTPLDYGSNLRQFLDAGSGVTPSSDLSEVTSWVDRDTADSLTVPSGGRSPILRTSIQNSLPGIVFEEDPPVNGALGRKLAVDPSAADNYFGQGDVASIGFAARLDRATDSRFGINNTIISKGYRDRGGWQLFIDQFGTMKFQHRRSNESTWEMVASGFYNVGDLVLGYITYDGGNSSNSGEMRLYNNSSASFVTAGTVNAGTASGIGTEQNDKMVVGNILDPNNADINACFQGPIFAVWLTRPALTYVDEPYLARWIP